MGTYYLPNSSGWSEQRNFGDRCRLRFKVVTSYNQATNKSTLTITLQSYCTAAAGTFVMTNNSQLTAGGTKILNGGDGYEVSYQQDSSWRDVQGAALTTSVAHDASGAASVDFLADIRFRWENGSSATDYATFYSLSATLNLQETRSYTLTISAGTGTSITVKRGGTTLTNGATIYHGDVLTVSFAAATGYQLSTHTVNGSSFTSGGTHTVSGAVSVAATAVKKTYTLTISAGTGSSITVKRGGTTLTNGATITHGDVLTVSFAASTGYQLSTHTVNGSSFTSGGSYTVSGAVSVAATAAKKTYTLTISAGTGASITVKRGGTTLANGATITQGDSLTISFAASSGYALSTHTVNGARFTSGGTHTVSGAVDVAATAAKKTYTLTISQGTGSTVTVKRGSTTLSNGASITHGETLTVSFAAASGYALSTHTVNGASFASGGTHVVSGAVSVTATASRKASTIASLSTSAATLGTISLTMNRAATNYHKATVTAGGNTLTTTAAFASSVAISVPRSWFSGYPSAASFTATVSVQSYTTSACTVSVGAAATKTLTIKADSGMKPVLQSGYMTLAPYNTGAVSGLSGYVSGYSKATATLNNAKRDMSAAVGASVASVKLTGGGVTATSAPYRTGVLTGKQTVTVTVTDTRGRSASQSITVSTLPYSPPKISAVTVFRCTSNGARSDEGAYFSVKATLKYSGLNGENSATLKANGVSLTSATAKIIYDGAASDSVIGVTIVARDRLGDATETRVTRTLPGRRWAMRFRANGRGVAFGMSPTEDETLETPDSWLIKTGTLQADSNANLISNWDWRDPVNQREIRTHTAGDMAFALDRCRHSHGTLTVGTGSVTWASDKSDAFKRIQLRCDMPLYAGVSYTASVLARVRERSGRMAFRICEDLTMTNSVTIPVKEGWQLISLSFIQNEASRVPSLEFLCMNDPGDYLTIEIMAWKLEQGKHQTLAREAGGTWVLTEQANKTDALLQSQRHYLPLGSYLRYPAARVASDTVDFFIPTPVQMAAKPNLTGAPQLYAGTALQSDFAFSVLEAGSNGVLLRASKSNHGQMNACLYLQGNGSALSAE